MTSRRRTPHKRLPRRPKKKLLVSFKYPLLPPASNRELNKITREFERVFTAAGRVLGSKRYIDKSYQIVEVLLLAQPENDPLIPTLGHYDSRSIAAGFGSVVEAMAEDGVISWAFAEKVQVS